MTRRTDSIRTRPDGSIDTSFYMTRGRRMRSEAAHSMAGHDTGEKRPRRHDSRLFSGFFV